MRKSLVLVVALALASAGCSDAGDEAPDPTAGSTTTLPEWAPTAGLPFREPQQILQGRDVAVTLDVKARTIDVSGQPLSAVPFEATPSGSDQPLPAELNGPTIHVSPGGTISVTIKNDYTQKTNIHYHGLHVSPLGDSDNVFRTMDPGGTYQSVVKLPDNHPAGTYWYHVHYHGNSQLQVNGGLSGLLMVDGVEKVLPPQYQGITQRQFALREVMTSGGSVITQSGSSTTTYLTNGLLTPALSIGAGESQLWRFAAIGPNATFYLQMKDHQFVVVAEDGNPLFNGQALPTPQLVLPPGKRYDVVVTGGAPGVYSLDATSSAPPAGPSNPVHSMASVTVEGGTATTAPAAGPVDLTVNAPDDGLRQDRADFPVAAYRTFTFMRGTPSTTTTTAGATTTTTSQPEGVCPPASPPPSGSNWEINGEVFDPNRLDVAVELDTYEVWTLCNTSSAIHPFHIHVNEFQVMSINGVPYDAPGVQDVVQIPAAYTNDQGQLVAGQVVIKNHYQDFTGWFVFHCHILAHEDNGMMQTIEVLRPGEQPSPPPHDGGAAHNRITVG